MTDSYSSQSAVLHNLANGVEWVVRPYREGDIPAIVALINAVDTAYKLEEGVNEADLRRSFESPRSDPARQAVVVDGPSPEGFPKGALLGYGKIGYDDNEAGSERIYYLRVLAHPALEGRGIEHAIAARLLEIILEYERDPQLKRMNKVTVKRYVREEYAPAIALCEHLGMKEVRQFWAMARSLHDPIDEPQPIEGVLIRNYKRPEDNKRALQAFNNSFADHWDHYDVEQADWDHATASPSMRPELSWLAESEDERGRIAGFCIIDINAEHNKRNNRLEGWIELLGTTRDWRRKGLGRALLLHGLHSLRFAGLDTALIGVDSESLTGAHRLYESVGFRIRNREIQYECALDEIKF